MCLKRWKQFKPTDEYLSVINQLDTVEKLHDFMGTFSYKPDKIKILIWSFPWDNWQTPVETMRLRTGDCEDMARFAVDVLVRVLKIYETRFIAYTGEKIGYGHSVAIFPYHGNNVSLKDKLSVFSNNNLIYTDSYLDLGHLFFKGLKAMEGRDWTGKVLERKIKLFGTF